MLSPARRAVNLRREYRLLMKEAHQCNGERKQMRVWQAYDCIAKAMFLINRITEQQYRDYLNAKLNRTFDAPPVQAELLPLKVMRH